MFCIFHIHITMRCTSAATLTIYSTDHGPSGLLVADHATYDQRHDQKEDHEYKHGSDRSAHFIILLSFFRIYDYTYSSSYAVFFILNSSF